MKLNTESFRGEVPRLTPRALPENAAQDATNARLLTGDVTAWRQHLLTEILANGSTVNSIALIDDKWMSWTEQVDVARGIIPGDTTFRTYLTGLDVPRFTNYALATTGAAPFPVTTRPLGVPAPDAAPTVVPGVDPNPTTFSVDIFDEGDSLATNWTAAPSQFAHGGATIVQQNASVGNPAPSYELLYDDNEGAPAYAYRNFGVANVNALRMSFDFKCTSGSGNGLQMVAGIARTAQGAGIQVFMDFSGNFGIGITTAWNTTGSSTLASTDFGTPSFDTWYTCEVSVIKNADATQTVTATLYLGSVQLCTVTATNSFVFGDYCGFVDETSNSDGIDRYRTFYDNILVRGSGSTGYNPSSTATSYLYTLVNDLGEESAPSFASVTVLRPDGIAITVTTPTDVPTGVSLDYGVTTKRIYRSATGATGTLFRFVAEIPLAQAEYVDSIPDTELGEALESEGWDLPPDDLRGILALPNGVMAGFRRNQLCLSAQNRPHAWPVANRYNTDTDIVGIGNIDTTVVIGTKSFPYVAGGNDPGSYSMAKMEVPQACVSKRSVAYLAGIGVVFATPDGLAAVAGLGQIRNLTETIFTREQWQALRPESIIGVAHDDVYHFFYDDGFAPAVCAISPNDGVFTLDVGNALSYPGTGQVASNVILSPDDGEAQSAYNFDLGETAIANEFTPRFSGTAGDCSAYFYPNAVSGSFGLSLADTQTPFLRDLHKAGAKYTIEAWIMTTDARPNYGVVPLFDSGMSDQGGYLPSRGMQFGELGEGDSASQNMVRVRRSGESDGNALLAVADAEVSQDVVHMLACSIDSTGAVPSFLYKDGAYDPVGAQDTWDGTYDTPTSNDTVNKASVMARSDFVSGTGRARLYVLRVYDRPLTKGELDAHWEAMRGRWGL